MTLFRRCCRPCCLTKLIAGITTGADKWVVGFAMVGRGEFAYLVAHLDLAEIQPGGGPEMMNFKTQTNKVDTMGFHSKIPNSSMPTLMLKPTPKPVHSPRIWLPRSPKPPKRPCSTRQLGSTTPQSTW